MLFTGLVLLIQVTAVWLWTRRYEPILQLLRNHNVLFTKVFQSLANSGNVNISPELRADLLKFTTNTTYENSDIDYETLDPFFAENDRMMGVSGLAGDPAYPPHQPPMPPLPLM